MAKRKSKPADEEKPQVSSEDAPVVDDAADLPPAEPAADGEPTLDLGPAPLFDEPPADEPSSLEDRPLEPEADPSLDLQPTPQPEAEPDWEKLKPRKPELPPVPSRAQLKEEGWTREASKIIVEHMKAIHDEIAALPDEPVKVFRTPGLRITTKRMPHFWVCGHQVKPGEPWEVALKDLDDKQLNEIRTVEKGNLIAVEEMIVELVG